MATIDVGIVIGNRFEVRAHIGGGGFGDVYHGYDLNLQRDIAIKRVKISAADFSEAQRARRREVALEEARKIALLAHPNIVSIYDALEYEDEVLIVMEYLRGGSLNDKLRQLSRAGGWLSVPESFLLLRDILSGLNAAHTAAPGPIIHQDLKPANILFDRDDVPKIADFGIAAVGVVKAIETVHPGRWPHDGTIGFMSPEQLRGAELDPRSDLFNVGLIGYLLLGNNHPFVDARFLFQYKEMVLEPYRTMPVIQHDTLPTEVGEFIGRLLALDPAERYLSAAEALAELDLVQNRYDDHSLSGLMLLHDALRGGLVPPFRPTPIDVVNGVALLKRKGLYLQGVILYERLGVDLAALPRKAREGLESDYIVCKRRVGREVPQE